MHDVSIRTQAILEQISHYATLYDTPVPQLVAVSKGFPPSLIEAATHVGQRNFGENYIQEALPKILAFNDWSPELAQTLVWHFIGRLQTNKAVEAAMHFDWVQSVDSLRLAQHLQKACDKIARPAQAPLNICLQVNIDLSLNKQGFRPIEVKDAIYEILQSMPCLKLRGLMVIPDPEPDMAATFLQARMLFDQLREFLIKAHKYHDFDTLSMGMSNDMEAAIAQKSTMVRIGSAIFGERPSMT